MNAFIKVICITLILNLGSCKEPYEHASVSKESYLVVDGFINASGKATIRLTRTVSLADSARIKPESGALVVVESEDSLIKNVLHEDLIEPGQKGFYSADLFLDKKIKYRLKIQTSNGREYSSDAIEIKESPPIDSVSWKRENGGVQIYVSTHDPSNSTRYYRWNFNEAWEIVSPYATYFEYKEATGVVVPREDYMSLLRCWGTGETKELLLGTSTKLSNDVIYEKPVIYIPPAHEKIGTKYSILVSQYALSKEAYEYLLNMKKNSEQLGSVFDPQPSEIEGNLFCVSDPKEKVIGYISGGTVTDRRIFIDRNEVPQWGLRLICNEIYVPPIKDSLEYYFKDAYNPTTQDGDGYNGVQAVCSDCRLRGGGNEKPDFWPN